MNDPRAPRARRWAAVAVGAVALIWLTVTALHRVFTGRLWVWVLPDLVPPLAYVLLPSALLVVAGLSAMVTSHRRRWLRVTAAASALALVLGAGGSGLNLAALTAAGPAVGPGAIRVMAWNAQYWDQGESSEDFYRYLRARDADVYLLQEYIDWSGTESAPVDKLARVRAEFPGYQVSVAGELITLSRLPVLRSEPISALPKDGTWMSVYRADKVLRTEVRAGGRVLTLYNVHIPVQLDADHRLDGDFYRDVRARVRHRDAVFDVLTRDLAATPGPVLVSGDMNTTAAMGDLDRLRSTLDDPTPANRALYPTSWPDDGGPRLWRLDWTFTRDLRVGDYLLEDSTGLSDHRSQLMVVAP